MNGLPVLMYHGVVRDMPGYAVYPGERTCLIRASDFEKSVAWCASRYRFLRLAEVAQYMADGAREPAVLLTFDDGLASVVDHAVPILRRYGATAVVFVTTGWLDSRKTPVIFDLERALWSDPCERLQVRTPSGLFERRVGGRKAVAGAIAALWDFCFAQNVAPLSIAVGDITLDGRRWTGPPGAPARDWWFPSEWDHLRAVVADGTLEVGAHGHTHKPWPWLTTEELETEILEPADRLEREFGVPVTACSYPHGMHDERVRDVVRSRYTWAFTNVPAQWRSQPNDLAPRFHIGSERPLLMGGILRWPLLGRVTRRLALAGGWQ